MAAIAPDVRTPSVMWVSCVGGAYFLFPSRPEIASWAIVGMSILSTAICLVDSGEEYFRQGMTHVNVASTLMIFFAGLGARGAATFAAALAIMFCLTASSSVLALNICVACFAQIVLYIILEVSLLHTLFEVETLVVHKAIEEKKASFMAIVSHELKSPLHGIIGLSSGLAATAHLNKTGEKHAALILSCAQRLLDMVTNIMDATVLVQDKQMKFSRDTVRLDELVEEVVILCQHAVDRRGQPLAREGVALINDVGRLPEIEADKHRCSQLLYNLVNNALKFTHKGSVRISGQVDESANTVILSVADTGIGIAPENHERVFRTFQQEDTSERRQYDGLGLGLSICREVATKHGGTLTVESSRHKGSTFRVTLPFRMKMPGEVEQLAQEALPVHLAPEAKATDEACCGTPKEEPSTRGHTLDWRAAAPAQMPRGDMPSESTGVAQSIEEKLRAAKPALQRVKEESVPAGAPPPAAEATLGGLPGAMPPAFCPWVDEQYPRMFRDRTQHQPAGVQSNMGDQGLPATLAFESYIQIFGQQLAQQSKEIQRHEQRGSAIQLQLRQHEVLLESLEKWPYPPPRSRHHRCLLEGLHYHVASLSTVLESWKRELAVCQDRTRSDAADVCRVRQGLALRRGHWDAGSHALLEQEKSMAHNLLQLRHLDRDLTKAEVAIAKQAELAARLQDLLELSLGGC